ncbi:MAG: hypothetical protein U5L76_02425 [Patescibacteria group bacterium]|nr:hypothetical protein [Patescibacteria group bacterium]
MKKFIKQYHKKTTLRLFLGSIVSKTMPTQASFPRNFNVIVLQWYTFAENMVTKSLEKSAKIAPFVSQIEGLGLPLYRFTTTALKRVAEKQMDSYVAFAKARKTGKVFDDLLKQKSEVRE